jgi:hypothetical protein
MVYRQAIVQSQEFGFHIQCDIQRENLLSEYYAETKIMQLLTNVL